MGFPIADLIDEDACYTELVQWLHPRGLARPRCGACGDLGVLRRHRAPILDLRCKACRRAFNAFTGTAPHGTERRPVELVPIVRGSAQGVPTARPAREPGCDRSELRASATASRRRPGGAWTGPRWGTRRRRPTRRPGKRGGRGVPHLDPADPPRRRADKARGHGTWDDGRPPICGVVGREGGQVRLTVAAPTDAATLRGVVGGGTRPGAMVDTDEWGGSSGLAAVGRGHATVCHAIGGGSG